MVHDFKCWIGWHKWCYPKGGYRICKKCGKSQNRVIYPWSSSREFWETKSNTNTK